MNHSKGMESAKRGSLVSLTRSSVESDAEAAHAAQTSTVISKLQKIYKSKVLPFEKRYNYPYFFSPHLTDSEFLSKPQVMLVGQYSVGKTTFIKYLLGRSFPGQRIGPEPTTDRFTVVINGPEERTIPGNALSVHPSVPYRGLERFGVNFLNRFEGSVMPSSVLQKISLIDTPGILAGEKQRLERGYDFTEVVKWFAERADLIIVLFDAHKLDISDELKNAIDALKGHDEKIRCILNKADQIDRQRLMRVYGALLWSMGKVISTPEVLKVYVGSFWSEPLQNQENKELFEAEENDLMNDLRQLPKQSAVRKINELVKRIRKARVLGYIISHLRSQMPSMMGKEKKQKQLIEDLPNQFRSCMKKYNLASGDFPELEMFKEKLRECKFSEFKTLSTSLMSDLDKVLSKDIPALMDALPNENDSAEVLNMKFAAQNMEENHSEVPINSSHKFADNVKGKLNPFGPDEDDEDDYWALQDEADFYRNKFQSLNPKNGFIDGATAKKVLLESNLSKSQLRTIWNLADIDRDGFLDFHEFALALYLADMAEQTGNVPDKLKLVEIPPCKRSYKRSQA